MKVKVITDCGTTYTATVEKNVRLGPHFALYELANNRGRADLPQWIDSPESRLFLVMLEEFRVWFDLPMTISSCYRQPDFNRSVGGDPRSAHLMATAADWHVKHTDRQRTNVTNRWSKILKDHGVIGAINYYSNGYHLEAFSDQCYGNKAFKVRDYRHTAKDW